ncbi:hypothetical protein GCM10025865_33470 (plasmid) [Paraoerskovia sediminicola]|uniref:Uncharacterized protein n=1 Tax=Paraoerskovia sediminicola TaxID=1138587 RepID=A0ABM8G7A7_9CELL|nr:hypothetical protein GCM10025865_33470 [Paraoerskovia sediminicola]
MGNVGAWFAYRLTFWRDAAGTVMRSRSQRQLARRAEARARARKQAEDRAAVLAVRGSASHSPAVNQALADVRAAIAQAKDRRRMVPLHEVDRP